MNDDLVFIALLITVTLFSVHKRKLTVSGASAGACISVAIFIGCGLPGVICLGCFFVAATIATSRGRKIKLKSSPAETETGRRDIFQVVANGGVSGILGATSVIFPGYSQLCLVMIACSMSAATADTVSSELGSVYGKRFFNILTLQRDKGGENGVVSLQGFIYGFAGSCMIAIAYSLAVQWLIYPIFVIILSGTIGNLVDSVLGASLERKGRVGNNAVNFLNTLAGALCGWILI